MIPHQPLSATEQRARLPAAVAKVWDCTDLVGIVDEAQLDGRDVPGHHAENVLDFHDGLRLIVSMERWPWGEFLHVSASLWPRSQLYRRCARGNLTVPLLVDMIQQRVWFIAKRTVTFAHLSPGKGVPHFYDPPFPQEIPR